MTDKKLLRKKMAALRDMVPAAYRENAAQDITEQVAAHPWYVSCACLLLFCSYGSEVSTLPLISKALADGKKVYLPRVLSKEEGMEFVRITSLTDLVPGFRGILEPAGEEIFGYSEDAAKHTLMIMPGLVFDREKNRIGYGGGFYDRYLADKENLRTVAIAYRMQTVEKIEADKKDIRPMEIITERIKES